MKIHMHYSTALPVLIKLLSISDGDVLELGAGLYSTPVLHWLCVPHNRLLYSYENSEYYFKTLGIQSFSHDYHKVELIDDWDKVDIERPWSVAFVDHAPAERRKLDIIRLASYAQYLVIHDTDGRLDKHYHYKEIWPLFKYRWDFYMNRPYTTVVSNFINLDGFSL